MNKDKSLDNEFEANIKSTLGAYARGEILAVHVARVIDELLANKTRSEPTLPSELSWESGYDLEESERFFDLAIEP